MLSDGNYFEVANGVVKAITVAVMDKLGFEKLSSEAYLHYMTVLKYPSLIVYLYFPILFSRTSINSSCSNRVFVNGNTSQLFNARLMALFGIIFFGSANSKFLSAKGNSRSSYPQSMTYSPICRELLLETNKILFSNFYVAGSRYDRSNSILCTELLDSVFAQTHSFSDCFVSLALFLETDNFFSGHFHTRSIVHSKEVVNG